MITAEFGDIIFFKPITVKSRLISFFDKGAWSHVALVLGMYENRILFVESHWQGVRVGLLVEDLQNFSIQKTSKKIKQTKQEILSFVGKKYDFKHLFFMGMFLMSHRLIPLPKTDEEKFICSELVNWAYGYTLSKKGKATPNTIWNWVQKQKENKNS